MTFIKENLLGDRYDWSTEGILLKMKQSQPTRNRFDRFNGNCVLHMINLFNGVIDSLSVDQGQDIEMLISNELPLVLSSEISVFNWLKERFMTVHPDVRVN